VTVSRDEAGGSLVEADVLDSRFPEEWTMFRCVYCNLHLVVRERDRDIEWCPNGCEHAYGETSDLEPDEIDPEDGWVSIRKRPVEVEARKVAEREEIDTREGTVVAQPGDFVIRGVEDEKYPIDPDILADTYERVEEGEKP